MSKTTPRPVIKIELSPNERTLEFAAVVGIALSLYVVAVYWARLPHIVPMHFGFNGKPDGWGPKWSILILPGVAIFMYALLSILSRYPHKWNYSVPITTENAERQYRIALSLIRWIKTGIIWLALYAEWTTIRVALGRQNTIGLGIYAFLAVIMGSVVLHLIWAYKAR